MTTKERLKQQQASLREMKELEAMALDMVDQAKDHAKLAKIGAQRYVRECVRYAQLMTFLKERLEKGILTVALLLIVALSGCGTVRGFGGLVTGIGDDIITTANGIENEIRNQK
jgi:predicted small secreted protein